ncbi:hypothetical protein PCANC_19405 [Puccinia coronata f. sp. avenae]|uniref:Uncharacterized protein n=1 Tax=Puccinia coronata f. sp. avenae TaxID=200324 RepID=A0A2N5SVM3_9BASI|nr:hypothetical protein PCANC_19405 [Puccinia coronata f. sp. avenae]PLW17281.1 hypothetical protein PCASD_18363 [Puccinia coronata f. sp. avenae]PLW40138.1 hypothetical protein PCASD_07833 [Puccinia coronata f. sp. avenae]
MLGALAYSLYTRIRQPRYDKIVSPVLGLFRNSQMTKTKLKSNCVLCETPDELQTCFSVSHEVVQFSGQASKVVIELRNLMASSTLAELAIKHVQLEGRLGR